MLDALKLFDILEYSQWRYCEDYMKASHRAVDWFTRGVKVDLPWLTALNNHIQRWCDVVTVVERGVDLVGRASWSEQNSLGYYREQGYTASSGDKIWSYVLPVLQSWSHILVSVIFLLSGRGALWTGCLFCLLQLYTNILVHVPLCSLNNNNLLTRLSHF